MAKTRTTSRSTPAPKAPPPAETAPAVEQSPPAADSQAESTPASAPATVETPAPAPETPPAPATAPEAPVAAAESAPAADASSQDDLPAEDPAGEIPAAAEEVDDRVGPEAIELTLPLLKQSGYAGTRHPLELTRRQAVALRNLTAGLTAVGAKLENGRVVSKGRDAIAFILEQLGTATE